MKEITEYLYSKGFAQAPIGTEDTSGGGFINTIFPIYINKREVLQNPTIEQIKDLIKSRAKASFKNFEDKYLELLARLEIE